MTKQNNGWVDLKGYEGIYQINTKGQVRSLSRLIYKKNNTQQKIKEKILKYHLNSSGYPILRLSNLTNGKREMARVHRLVAETFIPNPLNKPEVNHIDGNKQNFSIDNLEWVTSKENRKHAWDKGLRTREHLPIKYGENNSKAKLTSDDVIKMRSMRAEGISFSKIATYFNVAKKNCNGCYKRNFVETYSHNRLKLNKTTQRPKSGRFFIGERK